MPRRVPALVKGAAKAVVGRAGYALAYDNDYEPAAQRIMRSASEFTMTTRPRLYALWQSVNYVVKSQVPGDIVECGVWRGGSMLACALTLNELGVSDRTLYLCDTFEGMTEPTSVDVNALGSSARALLNRPNSPTKAAAGIDGVEQVMARSGYPANRIRYVVGDVCETLPAQAPERIALLRLDTDWYESTKHELNALFSRVSPGGVLLIDDYGFWEGARAAVDEFLEESGRSLLLSRVDSGCRVAIVT